MNPRRTFFGDRDLPAHIRAEEERLIAELPPEHRAQADLFVGRGHTVHEFDSAALLRDVDEDRYA